MSATERAVLELLYRQMCSVLVVLARVLGKPNPLKSKKDLQRERKSSSIDSG